MRKYIFSILILLLLLSCSPQKKLHRLVKKHPELTQLDTIKIIDTVIVPGTNIDTVFHSSLLHDTLTITKENLEIKLIEINDTIYLNADVKADTVIIERKIPVERIIHVETEKWWVRFWWVFLLVGFVFFVLVIKK